VRPLFLPLAKLLFAKLAIGLALALIEVSVVLSVFFVRENFIAGLARPYAVLVLKVGLVLIFVLELRRDNGFL